MNTAALALWASITRTLVPVIVGAVVAGVVGPGITVDPEFEPQLAGLLTLAFTAVYYIAVRLLETYVAPNFGWLLGLAKSPTSYTPDSPARHSW